MSDHDDQDGPEIEVEIELEEDILDDELMKQFADTIEKSIVWVFSKNVTKDGRRELVNILMSLAASISTDIDISDDEFLNLACYYHEEASEHDDSEEIDKSKLN
jgi:hypothetical protein